MESLPNEIVILILSKVELSQSSCVSPSTLEDLYRCSYCSDCVRCTHLHPFEVEMAYTLRQVCKLWDNLIHSHFNHFTFWKPLFDQVDCTHH